MWHYSMNFNMSYARPMGWNTCCMPQMYYCRPAYPMYGNSIFYQMNMMNNMYALGQITGNNLMSLFGFNRVQSPHSYVYPQTQFGMYTTPGLATSTSGIERTSQKAKAIDWSKLNPFKKITAKRKAQKAAKAEVARAQVSTQNNLPRLSEVGYNSQKGVSLAQDAAVHAKKKSRKLCAKYVKKAIDRQGLGQYENGHAYQCDEILSRNPNFKEVKVTKDEFKNLPAGCIVVYPKGDVGYSKKYGHIEISMGNGKSVSDFINNNLKPSDNARVFVPVSA